MNDERRASAHAAAEAVAHQSYGKLVAYLAATSRDVAAAEDALADAFAKALTEWPRSGCPASPEAWLLTVARRKLIDGARHRRGGDAVSAQLQLLGEGSDTLADDTALPDRRLGLLFACAHPAIDAAIRAPLMLQTVLGLDARRIASAFLTSPAAMGKRLGRAKEKIRQAGIPLRIPAPDELAARLDSVLDAIYAAFADSWSDPGNSDGAHSDLAGEALFLARLVAQLLPDEPETLGLLACMLYAHARRDARRGRDGDYVPLAAQETALWDAPMIGEAEMLLQRASRHRAPGRFQLEAALQSAHVERCHSGRDNWDAVLQLYDALAVLTASSVVAINRALAVAEVHGAEAGLAALPDPTAEARLDDYQPYWAARADLLARTGALDAAWEAYALAIGLERDEAVRRFLQQRREALIHGNLRE